MIEQLLRVAYRFFSARFLRRISFIAESSANRSALFGPTPPHFIWPARNMFGHNQRMQSFLRATYSQFYCEGIPRLVSPKFCLILPKSFTALERWLRKVTYWRLQDEYKINEDEQEMIVQVLRKLGLACCE